MGNFLVTGASGFVGGALTRQLLREGNRVITVLRDGEAPRGCEVVRGSVADPLVMSRALTKLRLDGVYHLAAHAKVEECHREPIAAFDSNVRGTYLLLEMATGMGIPIVVATTDHVYGDRPLGSPPATEDQPFVGGGIYDTSKACADMIALCYGQRLGADVRIVRCGNIYGPGDTDESRIVPSLMADLINERPLTIRSDGTPVREYLYIDDAVGAYAVVMSAGRAGRAYNFAGAQSLSVIGVAKAVKTVWDREVIPGSKEIVVLGQRTGDIRQLRLDTTRAQTELGWRPCIHLDPGLCETMDWWIDRHNAKIPRLPRSER